MTISMAESHSIFEEEDRISDLPRNVIDCIMELLSVRDAARTCVLSSKWRYVWADHPWLVLDYDFWVDIKLNRLLRNLPVDYADIVSSILLYHVGDIRKFVIDVAIADYLPDFKMDLWLSSLCRRSLNRLDIENSEPSSLYKIPSSVFSSSELTHLNLWYCIIKAKDTSGCFTNIQSLILTDVTLDLMVLKAPLLTTLIMSRCSGLRYFDISAPRLASLTLDENDCHNLKPFLTCKGIKNAFLYRIENFECHEDCERITLLDLFASWPMISRLHMVGSCFKYLARGRVPKILQHKLADFLLAEMEELDSKQIAWILCILKNSPLLHTFELWFLTPDGEEVDGVDEPSINTDYMIEQPLTIKLVDFSASKVEIMFAKSLLRSAPLLRKMRVGEKAYLDPKERIEMLKKVLVLQREFPMAQITFVPSLYLA